MDKQSVNLDLTTGVVWKRLLLFFLPIAAGTCIQQLYNAVDGLIVGRFVGTEALAAVGGSSAQIINLLIGFFVAITSGASIATVVAQIINMILLTLRLMRAKASWRLSFREMKLKGVYLANMFRLGIPAGLQNAMYGVSNMIVQIGVNSLGTVVVASWAMTSKSRRHLLGCQQRPRCRHYQLCRAEFRCQTARPCKAMRPPGADSRLDYHNGHERA